MKTLLIRSTDFGSLCDIVGLDSLFDLVIERLKQELSDFEPESGRLPQREGFVTDPESSSVTEWMPYAARRDSIALKVISYNPRNHVHGYPTIVGAVGIYDAKTGQLAALADAAFITALRTGATSAVASQALALPSSSTLGIVGAGAQAVAQVRALTRVLPIKEVLAYDINLLAAQSLKRRVGSLSCSIRAASLDEVEGASDVLCTATSVGVNEGPVISGDRLRDHVHINAVGSDLRGKTELPRSVLTRSLVCPDFRSQAVVEGESQQLDAAAIGPELGEVLRAKGEFDDWRSRPTVFDSTGIALEDHVAMDAIIPLIREHGLGLAVDLTHTNADVLNPFDFPARIGVSGALEAAPSIGP